MVRFVALSVFALLVSGLTLLAGEYKGTVVSADPDKNTITVKVDDKDKTFKVDKDTKFLAGMKDIPDGLGGKMFSKAGAEVTIKTDGTGDKEVVKEVSVKGKKKDKQ